MTEILCRWLNEDVHLCLVVEPSTFPRDFANGFLIGELLRKYKLQDDFDQFSRGNSSESKLNNFTRLEPVIKFLNVPFNTNMARDVMMERHGAATRLLYQLFISLHRGEEPQLLAHQSKGKMSLNAVESGIYKKRLAHQTKRQVDLNFEALIMKFQERQKEQESMALKARFEQEEQLKKQRDEARLVSINKSRQVRETNNAMYQSLKLSPIKEVQKTSDASTLVKSNSEKMEKEAKSMRSSIEAFEASLALAIPPPPDQRGTVTLGEGLQSRDLNYVKRIRERLRDENEAKKERQRRRRKVLVELLKVHEVEEEAKREEFLVNRLMRQSQQERRIVTQLMQLKGEKDVIRRNRLHLNRQYEERRAQDFEESLAREAKLAQLEKDQYQTQLQVEREIHQQLIAEKIQKRYEKHYRICHQMVEQIIDLATVIGEYRELTERSIPAKLMQEWKTLFLNGLPIYEEDSKVVISTEPAEMKPNEKTEELDKLDYSEYKNASGEWEPSLELSEVKLSLKGNVILSHVVQKLYSIVYPPHPEPPLPKFPEFPIKACFLGKSFCGKSKTAKQLASKHRLQILSVSALLNEAIEAFRDGEEDPDEVSSSIVGGTPEQSRPATGLSESLTETKEGDRDDAKTDISEGEPKLSTRSRLGRKANRNMLNGQAVDDQTIVEVLVHAIRQVPEGTGWLLEGFPTTLRQAKLLEKALTGFEPTRKPRGSEKPAKGRLSSRKKPALLPVKESTELFVQVASGIDVVILFNQADEMSIKRAVGRKVDPQTGEEYHLELKEPAFGSSTGVLQSPLLVSVQDPNFEAEQIQHRLAHFRDQWPKLKTWFSQFNNLVEIDSSETIEKVSETVEGVLTDFLEKRKEAAEEAERAKLQAAKNAEEASVVSVPTEPAAETEGKDVADVSAAKQSHVSLSAKESAKAMSRQTSVASSAAPLREPETDEQNADMKAPQQMPEAGSDKWVYVDKDLNEEVAQFLATLWDDVELHYVESCKHVFRKMRNEREVIIQYFYSTKKNFYMFLERPDKKQEFVSQFQKHYNEDISEDMRTDSDMKSQLHQEIDDLKERLWDISDRRREEAEDDRQTVMNEQWLEDHIGLMGNYYVSLMQVEVDRYEDSLHVLKDYYLHVEGKSLEERGESYAYQRLPLVEIPELEGAQIGDEGTEDETPKPNRSPGESAEEGESSQSTKKRIPLVRRRVPSPEAVDATASAGSKKHGGKKSMGVTAAVPPPPEEPEEPSGPVSNDPDEQLLLDAHYAAMNASRAMAAKEEEFYGGGAGGDGAASEKELAHAAKLAKGADKGKAKKKPKSPAAKKGGSGKKERGDKGQSGSRKSNMSLRSEPETPSLSNVTQTPDEAKAKEEKEKVRMEHLAAVQIEENRLKFRLDLIKEKAIALVQDLKNKALEAWTEMDDRLGARFKQEMESIESLSEVLRQAIENEEKLLPGILLSGPDLIIDEGTQMFEIPPPPRPDTPPEDPFPDTYTVIQLRYLSDQMTEVAPSGVISGRAFIQKMQEVQALSYGEELMPELWSTMPLRKLEELTMMLVPADADYLDWRHFLTLASLPWPAPTQSSLLETLARFREADVERDGRLSFHEYMKVQLWFPSMPHDRSLPYDPNVPLRYDRNYNLRQAFFRFFKEKAERDDYDRVDYVNLLLNFCVHEDPVIGVFQALSVATGHPLPSTSVLEEYTEGEEGSKGDDFEIPLDAFIKVLHLGKASLGFSHRFRDTTDPNDALSRDRLMRAYERHGAGEDKPLAFSVFAKDSVVGDCIHACKRYKKIDFRSLVAPLPQPALDESVTIVHT